MLQKKLQSFLYFSLLGGLFLFPSCSSNSQGQQSQMDTLIHDQLTLAVKQYKDLMTHIPEGKMPRTFDSSKNKLITSDKKWWTVGFYPGTLWYLYEYSKDSTLKNEAEKEMKLIESNKNNTGTHDVGFMMYCSFGNGYRITRNPHYKKVLLTSAASLSTRFNDTVGGIKSWNWKKDEFPVIIDNMMNLELLCWASQNGGSPKYEKEAISHANVTMKNHFRPDYSSWHVVVYNPHTGEVERKQTAQGYADSSAWARGQSWGLYGYTMMFRETHDSTYLQFAEHIAHYILNNPTLPDDMIPYWDYDAPKIPNAYRDVSAASVMASAFLELSRYATNPQKAKKYKAAGKTILINLSKPPYRCKLGEDDGFLLKHSVGSLPGNTEVDVPLTYADYYYVEALLRYKNWFLNKQ